MLIRIGTRSPFILIVSTIMAIYIDLKLSIIFLITTPLIALVIYLVMSKPLPLYKVIEQGNHKYLLNQSRFYSKLYNSQFATI